MLLKSEKERSIMTMDLDFDEFLKGLWGKSDSESQDWVKWVHRNLTENHCPECLVLDGCWFAGNNHPRHPHHQFCHCVLEDLPYERVLNDATSYSSYSKFDPFLFNTKGEYSHGKEKLFKAWGYTVDDSEYLKKEFERQALQKYISGDYQLGLLNDKGQRISIRIKLARKDKADTISFMSGWMVYPNGKIQLTTPYGGK